MTPGRATPPRLRRRDTPPESAAAAPAPDAAEPLAGVSSAIITAATRRVARRWRDEAAAAGKPAAESETMAGLLAAMALAVDQGRPGYVTSLLPRPTPSLGHRLVEMLQTELLQAWSESATPISPSAILGTLNALEQVRQAISDDPARELSQRLSTSTTEGLDLLVEVIHDLRSPLTSILFLAETLQRGQSGPVNEVQHRQVGLIYSAALGLSALVADAIELARGGDELADGDPSPFSVAELMESVRTIVRPMAEEKGLAVRLLPPNVDHRLGFPVALSRVLLNLTTNALKFTEQGFVELLCEETTGDRVTFAVRDTGPGVNPEALATLFQPFRRARGRHGYCFSGTGLGLAITRKLVEAMHSTLALETRANWGTRFSFELDLPPHATAAD
ncbi:MAG TPA: HAMP domain-containing sensor histidine kinase [Gemmatimonadales bacterium]|nr:HAMP domain-containing sensor histidine kinase [Gemmatimonadales bacterium]